jgi:hypothetical protein
VRPSEGFFDGAILGVLVSCCTVLFVSNAIGAEETKWRLVKPDSTGELMLVMTDTDEATDAIGSPSFRCKAGSGFVTVQNDLQDSAARRAIADLILKDGYPTVELVPGPGSSVIEEIVSSDDSGWNYHFQAAADAAAFNAFGKTGYFQFKIGRAVIKAGVKAGLEKITEFQAACRQLPKPSAFDIPKVQR